MISADASYEDFIEVWVAKPILGVPVLLNADEIIKTKSCIVYHSENQQKMVSDLAEAKEFGILHHLIIAPKQGGLSLSVLRSVLTLQEIDQVKTKPLESMKNDPELLKLISSISGGCEYPLSILKNLIRYTYYDVLFLLEENNRIVTKTTLLDYFDRIKGEAVLRSVSHFDDDLPPILKADYNNPIEIIKTLVKKLNILGLDVKDRYWDTAPATVTVLNANQLTSTEDEHHILKKFPLDEYKLLDEFEKIMILQHTSDPGRYLLALRTQWDTVEMTKLMKDKEEDTLYFGIKSQHLFDEKIIDLVVPILVLDLLCVICYDISLIILSYREWLKNLKWIWYNDKIPHSVKDSALIDITNAMRYFPDFLKNIDGIINSYKNTIDRAFIRRLALNVEKALTDCVSSRNIVAKEILKFYEDLSLPGRDDIDAKLFPLSPSDGRLRLQVKEEHLRRAIQLASKCTSEDGRIKPKVGALIIKDGRIISEAYRNELGDGDHAESTAIKKLGLKASSIRDLDLREAILVTTMEPCTQRKHELWESEKVSCSDLIKHYQIKKVIIGMYDPNPLTRKDECWLFPNSNMTVDHFPPDMSTEIKKLNADFLQLHRKTKT